MNHKRAAVELSIDWGLTCAMAISENRCILHRQVSSALIRKEPPGRPAFRGGREATVQRDQPATPSCCRVLQITSTRGADWWESKCVRP